VQPPFRDRFLLALAALGAVAIIRLWVLPLADSFWLDETLVAWTARHRLEQIIPTAFVRMQSVLFCLLEWAAGYLPTTPEISHRLPSVAAAGGCLYVYYSIGLENLDREAGAMLATLYLALPSVALEIPNARPYSLALLAQAGAILWMLRWLRSGRLRDGLYWAVCASVSSHFHHLFMITYPLQGVFVLWHARKGRLKTQQAAAVAMAGGVLMLPALPQALMMAEQGSILSFGQRPSVSALFQALVPLNLIAVLLLVAALERASGWRLHWVLAKRGREAAALAALLLAPVAVLFALSRWTDLRLFETRYLLPTVPGLVILSGWALRAVEPPLIRRTSLVLALAVAIVVAGPRKENWRSAVLSMPDSGARLVYSGLVETRRLEWLQLSDRWGYLAAPVAFYRPTVSPDDTFLVPFDFAARERAYVERLLQGPIGRPRTITVIARLAFDGPLWVSWLSDRLRAAGFNEVRSTRYDMVELRVFQIESAERPRGGANQGAATIH
jgi:hypothetical protein